MGTTTEPMIQHHLEDEMLMLYAAGRLSEGWSVAAATHLALCPSCRGRVGVYEAIGGHFLASEEPIGDDDDVAESWSRLKSRLGNEKFPDVVTRDRSAGDTLLPQPLRSYVDRAGGFKWQTLGTGGAAQMIVPTEDKSTTVRLLRIAAGQPVPEHTHRGDELTLVLAGSFSDQFATFRRGDVEMADSGVLHAPRAGHGQDCICLAVTDAPLKFSSSLLRLLQPLLGI
ncbi:ChrR family anti-sigma-E factor [Rhizobium sp. SIMBA_035]